MRWEQDDREAVPQGGHVVAWEDVSAQGGEAINGTPQGMC